MLTGHTGGRYVENRLIDRIMLVAGSDFGPLSNFDQDEVFQHKYTGVLGLMADVFLSHL